MSDPVADFASDFALLDDWDQRYFYLQELGQALAAMPDAQKTEENRVKACMSRVWVYAYRSPEDPSVVFFNGDCDTPIIKGVVALLIQLYSGHTIRQALSLDMDGVFERIHLADHLSPNRHVGIYAIVDVMRKQLQALKEA